MLVDTIPSCKVPPVQLSEVSKTNQKTDQQGLEIVKPYVIGPNDQLLLHKFFDLIIPSMRNSKIQNGRQGVPKWPIGSGKGSTPSNFR